MEPNESIPFYESFYSFLRMVGILSFNAAQLPTYTYRNMHSVYSHLTVGQVMTRDMVTMENIAMCACSWLLFSKTYSITVATNKYR